MSKPKDKFTLTKPPEATENDVEAGCLRLLAIRGYYPIRLHSGFFRTMDGKRVLTIGTPGLPDYCVLHTSFPGFLLETKRRLGRYEESQRKLIPILKLGYKLAVCVARSAADLSVFLNEHEQRKA